jgi:hypothetical protein
MERIGSNFTILVLKYFIAEIYEKYSIIRYTKLRSVNQAKIFDPALALDT